MVKIYTLSHPVTNEIRYVGKTTETLEKRLKRHFYESKQKSCHRHFWINSLTNEGLIPKIEIVDEVAEDNWQFWETYWISQFKNWGFNLVNLTLGGEGFNWKGKTHSEKSKQKMSESKSGKPSWNKNKNLSESHKVNLSNSHMGKKLSKESINKRNESVRIPVSLIDSSGNVIKNFIGITQASRDLGLAYDQIAKIIETGIPSKKRGYLFRYI